MGLIFVKKMSLLFLLVSAFLFSASLAAGPGSRIVNGAAEEVDEDAISTFEKSTAEEIDATIHGRLLKANNKDYGVSDPSPTVNKPPYKVIQN
ncbi:hypothetical protein SLA2020_054020 [Shorea laevis]